MEKVKTCSKTGCTETENLIKYSKTKTKKGFTQYYYCRKHNTERAKKYRKTPIGRKNIYNAVYKSTAKHYYKQLARVKVNRALRDGLLKKPNTCPDCNKKKPVEAHHPDYSKPLTVVWVCRQCHPSYHKNNEA